MLGTEDLSPLHHPHLYTEILTPNVVILEGGAPLK